ncbi:MAG TPA: phosphatidylserine decarboxylase, partial [Thermodesulfovibrionales bacterium]|nr:phosphatidylserine decarboxylase [Thermodesulfovibrionales bacterium]
MIKFAPEGYPFIFGFLAATGVAYFIAPWAAAIPFALALFMAYFFRDPEREIPGGDDIFVSPADGKVILREDLVEGSSRLFPALLEGSGQVVEVSIFMSPLDVHVNRAPCDGTVGSVIHTPGRFLSAFKHEASAENENIAMVLDTKYGKVLVRQVAGFLARRAVCRVNPGDRLDRGVRYGLIKFSSRVDIYLPKGTLLTVKPGDRVKAGESVLGR